MAEVRKNPAEQPELRSSAPHQGGPLGSSGAAPGESSAEPASPAAPASASAAEPAAKAETTPVAAPASSPAPAAASASPSAPDAKAVPASVDEAGGATTAGEKAAAPATTTAAPATTTAASSTTTTAAAAPAAAGKGRRFQPVRAVGRGGNAVVAWARRPSGRVVLPGLVVVLLVALAGTAGAYLVPRALEAPAPTATPAFGASAGAAPPAGASAPGAFPSVPPPVGGALPPGVSAPPTGLPTAPAAGLPTIAPTGLPTVAPTGVPGGLPTVQPTVQPTAAAARPADALAAWAGQVGTQVGIPVVAVQAYGYAELVTAKTTPSCRLSWTTLAAIAKVESEHGSANGAVLGADGMAQPTIYGLPLDGQGGRQLIVDTDRGALDGDARYDRAIGPMQFLPGTWRENAVDADRSGTPDPSDIDDAALTAAVHLCKGGRDMTKAQDWWNAILSYNALQPQAQEVFSVADEYGRRSRT